MKPALYIVQRTGPRVRLDRLDQDTEEEAEEDDTGECRDQGLLSLHINE